MGFQATGLSAASACAGRSSAQANRMKNIIEKQIPGKSIRGAKSAPRLSALFCAEAPGRGSGAELRTPSGWRRWVVGHIVQRQVLGMNFGKGFVEQANGLIHVGLGDIEHGREP